MKTIKNISYIMGFIGFALFLNLCNSILNSPPVEPTEQQKIERQFSAWDGVHIKLKEFIQSSMNDPKSFEHIDSKYWIKTDHLIVLMKYRGKNIFGGIVPNFIQAKIDKYSGEIIEVLAVGN